MITPTAFAQRGNTRRFIAKTGRAPSAIQMTVATDMPQADNYIITNFGPNTAFVGYGSSSAEAIDNAQIPEDRPGGSTFCFIVPPGQRSIEAKHGVFIAAVTASGTADLFVTPGKGSIESDTEVAIEQTSNTDLANLVLYAVRSVEVMEAILIELRTQTEFLKEGLSVAEDPDLIRGDQTNSIN